MSCPKEHDLLDFVDVELSWDPVSVLFFSYFFMSLSAPMTTGIVPDFILHIRLISGKNDEKFQGSVCGGGGGVSRFCGELV